MLTSGEKGIMEQFKSMLFSVLWSAGFLILGVSWFCATMVLMTDVFGIFVSRSGFQDPIPAIWHPLAWTYAVIGWAFMKYTERGSDQVRR